MSWKKFIIGEKMPDKDDPEYHSRYEKEVEAGRRFAQLTKIDRIAVKVQRFANGHKQLFLAIVFGLLFLCFALNIYRIGKVCNNQQNQQSAVERQEEMVRSRSARIHKVISSAHTPPSNDHRDY